MRRTYAGQAARHNFAAFGDELRQRPHVLVVDGVYFFHAEFANFLAPEIFASAFAAAGTTGSAGTRRAAFAAERTFAGWTVSRWAVA